MNRFLFLMFFVVSCKYFGADPVVIEGEKLEDDYKICFIGDTGTGKKEQFLVADVLEKESCSQIRLLGDVIYEKGIDSVNDSELEEKFLKPYKNILENTPIYIVLGNHDYKKKPQAWIDVSKKIKNVHMPAQFYADIYEDICILSIDANAHFANQFLWMKKTRKKYFKKCKYVLTVGHTPYRSSGHHGNAPGYAKIFFKKMVLKHSTAYIAGHDHHLSDEGIYDEVHHFVSGAGGKLRPLEKKPKVWGVSKLGYMTVTVERKNDLKLKFDFITVDKDSGDKKIEHSGYIKERVF